MDLMFRRTLRTVFADSIICLRTISFVARTTASKEAVACGCALSVVTLVSSCDVALLFVVEVVVRACGSPCATAFILFYCKIL